MCMATDSLFVSLSQSKCWQCSGQPGKRYLRQLALRQLNALQQGAQQLQRALLRQALASFGIPESPAQPLLVVCSVA